MRVSIPPGVDGIPTASIPTDPQAFVTWFTSVYLKRWAANGDARNAVPTSASVQITGSIGTPAGIGIGPNSITNEELVERSPLSVMGNAFGVEANVQDIIAPADGDSLQRIGGALVWAPAAPVITAIDSITGLGTVSSPLELVNDNSSPGNTMYYGTNSSGAKGFYPIAGSSVTTLVQSGGASQIYNVPSGANVIEVICIGGGGGAGSGPKEASGTASGGAGGGGGGGISWAKFRAADLGATVTVTFSNAATGGNGAAAISVIGTPGANGINGSNVSFGGLLIASGGLHGGGGGIGSGGAAGTGGVGNWQQGTSGGGGTNGGAGNAGSAQGNATLGSSCYGPTGGGAGAGMAASPGTLVGAAGGAGTQFMTLAGGAAGGGNGVAGSGLQPSSGGGGGTNGISTNSATPGGNGGGFGGGGGGGAACLNTGALSGAGGTGGPAACIILAY